MKLSEAQARTMIDTALAEGRRLGKPITVAVVDAGGYLISLARMDGAGILTPQIAEAKAFTGAAWNRSTAEVAERFKANPGTWQAFLDVGRVKTIPGQGGFPIKSGKDVIGGIGVSGATGDEDEAIAKAAIAAAKLG